MKKENIQEYQLILLSLQKLNDKLDNLQIENNRRFDNINKRFDDFNAEMNKRFDNINNRIDTLVNKISEIKEDVAELKTQIKLGIVIKFTLPLALGTLGLASVAALLVCLGFKYFIF